MYSRARIRLAAAMAAIGLGAIHEGQQTLRIQRLAPDTDIRSSKKSGGVKKVNGRRGTGIAVARRAARKRRNLRARSPK